VLGLRHDPEKWRCASVEPALNSRGTIDANMPKGYLVNAVHLVAFDATKPVHCKRPN
jgi:hypothetical protein